MSARSSWNRMVFLCGSIALFSSAGAGAKAPSPVCEDSDSEECAPAPTSDCLAQGTQITLANGSTVPIEGIQNQMTVQSDSEGQALAVLARVGGRVHTQDVLMLEDDLGHLLTLTVMHSVITVEYGPVPAMSLEPGDLVYTDEGIARLTQVDWSSEDVRVFNLLLNDRAAGTLEEVDTTMFANGFLVGDGRMELQMTLQSHRAGGRAD